MTLPANTELVTIAWLGGVTGLTPAMVATQLPADNTSWAASGFVTVRTVGGSQGLGTPMREPVMTLDFWAVKPGSGKPPWYQANYLAELVCRGCRASDMQRTVTLPTGYAQARVLSVHFVNEPRRSYADAGDYAHYVGDIVIHWVEVS